MAGLLAPAARAQPGIGGAPAPDARRAPSAHDGGEVTPVAADAQPTGSIYDNGFYLRSADNAFSIHLNGLLQSRYTWFDPKNDVAPLGATPGAVNNFDVYLGRFAVSGSAFDPKLKYFLQFQGSTAGNSNTATMLDWFISREFSRHLVVQAGRFWTA